MGNFYKLITDGKKGVTQIVHETAFQQIRLRLQVISKSSKFFSNLFVESTLVLILCFLFVDHKTVVSKYRIFTNTLVFLWIRCMLCVCHTTPTQKLLCLHVFLSSGWAITTGRLLGPKMGNSIKCLFQEHSDAILHRESNQGFATFLYSGALELQHLPRSRQPGFDSLVESDQKKLAFIASWLGVQH